MDKALGYLALARKAGRIELGEEPVGAAARAKHAWLVVVASDASDHTWRRAGSFVAQTDQQRVQIPYTKDELGSSVGRTSLAIAAITDPVMALAFLQSLEHNDRYADAMESLSGRTARIRRHQQEEKVHLRRKRRKATGKKN